MIIVYARDGTRRPNAREQLSAVVKNVISYKTEDRIQRKLGDGGARGRRTRKCTKNENKKTNEYIRKTIEFNMPESVH